MPSLVEPLSWDTAFFGIPIGRADLDGADPARLRAIDAEARRMGIACLYGSLDPTDNAANSWVQMFGHRLVEVPVTFERPAKPFTPRTTSSTVRPGTLDDLPTLEPALRRLAPWSRFSVDGRFGVDAAYRMHRAWVERAARERHERALYVSEDGSGVTGLATFVRTPIPRLDLIAVTERACGAADALTASFLEWSDGGPTQGGPAAARNLASLRFYTRCGFRICQTRYLFHRWLDEAGPPP